MKIKGYVLFFGLFSVIIAIITIAIPIIAFSLLLPEYPVYAYRDYVDRSESKVFKATSGAQIYEAEKAVLSGDFEIKENVAASAEVCLSVISVESTVKYEVVFSEKCNVQVSLSIYNQFECESESLFSVYFNGRKIEQDDLKIESCYNEFDFKEKVIASLQGEAGNNEIKIVSNSEGWTLDYLLLVSDLARVEQEETIAAYTYDLIPKEKKQIYESEQAERNGAFIFYETDASNEYYTQFVKKDDFVVFYIESPKFTATQLSLRLNNYGTKKYIADLCDVYVNGIKYNFDQPLTNDRETLAGNIWLSEGENQIKIVGVGSMFTLDYILLNANVDYSTQSCVRYEAEEYEFASLYCSVEDEKKASGGKVVELPLANTEVIFNFNSVHSDEAYLVLTLKYTGSEKQYQNIFQITVNGKKLNLSNVSFNEEIAYGYLNVCLGKINVREGTNFITVACINKTLQIDCISLFNTEISAEVAEMTYEAESAVLAEECNVLRGAKRSGKQTVKYNAANQSLTFFLYAETNCSFDLTMSAFYGARNDTPLANCISVNVNEQILDISQKETISFKGQNIYQEYDLGNIELKQGLNVITLTSKVKYFNVDYILLVPLS